MSGEQKPAKQGLIDKAIEKTTLASFAAFTAVVVGLGASAAAGKWEVFSLIVGAAVGYLFPKQK